MVNSVVNMDCESLVYGKIFFSAIKISCFILFFQLLFPCPKGLQAGPLPIKAVGGWTETIDGSDLTIPWTAGCGLNNTCESSTTAARLNIKYSGWWRVDIKRSDNTWHNDFTLKAKKSGDSYIEVTTVDTELLCGQGNQDTVYIQYELSGMSLSIPPCTYNTTIIYTIVEIGSEECP